MLSSGLRHQVKGRAAHPRAVVVDGVAAGVAREVAAPVLITGGSKWVYAVAILWFWNEKLRLSLFFYARWGSHLGIAMQAVITTTIMLPCCTRIRDRRHGYWPALPLFAIGSQTLPFNMAVCAWRAEG